MDSIWREIEELRAAPTAQLCARYRELFQEEPRSKHRQHLFRRLAWRLQANAYGVLSDQARQRALEIANHADLRILPPRGLLEANSKPVGRAAGPRWRFDPRIPPPGTLLKREYQGHTILVTVLGAGFEYESRRFGSLSAIASEATGTRWNGLAFFGLTPGRRRSRRGRHV